MLVAEMFKFELGEKVYDDLTRTVATIIGIKFQTGKCGSKVWNHNCLGIWLDNDWLGGGRHPWEITKIGEYECL